MSQHYADESVTLHHGDCLAVLRTLADASVDAVVTDPPYGLEFMGREWDGADGFRRSLNAADVGRDNAFGRTSRTSPEYRAGTLFQQWCEQWAIECLRVLKPGGHLLAFGGTRTWHRLACAVEDAGFEMRDSIAWLYGSGFPKSLDVSKAIDKAAGATREVVGEGQAFGRGSLRNRSRVEAGYRPTEMNPDGGTTDITTPATGDARTWQGWGTALKPAFEPVVQGRKPLIGTVAANVLAHGTGALNIDGCRVGREEGDRTEYGRDRHLPHANTTASLGAFSEVTPYLPHASGRWPANVVLDRSQAAELDRQSGATASRIGKPRGAANGDGWGMTATGAEYDDQGGASRFFPVFNTQEQSCGPSVTDTTTTGDSSPAPSVAPDGASTSAALAPIETSGSAFRYEAKAPTIERPRDGEVAHPTVKPLDLMRWLVRLVTPPGGTVLDPFAGSGTTAEACVIEGFRCIAIEREADYLPLILTRLSKPIQPDMFGGAR